MNRLVFTEGDILLLKKPHPCGGKRFRVGLCGSDCKLICVKCGREVMIQRLSLEKSVKSVERPR